MHRNLQEHPEDVKQNIAWNGHFFYVCGDEDFFEREIFFGMTATAMPAKPYTTLVGGAVSTVFKPQV